MARERERERERAIERAIERQRGRQSEDDRVSERNRKSGDKL